MEEKITDVLERDISIDRVRGSIPPGPPTTMKSLTVLQDAL